MTVVLAVEGYSCRADGCEELFTKWSLLRKHMADAHRKGENSTSTVVTLLELEPTILHEGDYCLGVMCVE